MGFLFRDAEYLLYFRAHSASHTKSTKYLAVSKQILMGIFHFFSDVLVTQQLIAEREIT